MTKLFTLIHEIISFTVVGHYPIVGRYICLGRLNAGLEEVGRIYGVS